MGLKTTNYEVKRLGTFVPQAYAIIKKLHIENNSGKATFVVQSTRETTKILDAFDTIEMHFIVNKKENPYVTAYNKAKGQNGIFYGWKDDIVVE